MEAQTGAPVVDLVPQVAAQRRSRGNTRRVSRIFPSSTSPLRHSSTSLTQNTSNPISNPSRDPNLNCQLISLAVF